MTEPAPVSNAIGRRGPPGLLTEEFDVGEATFGATSPKRSSTHCFSNAWPCWGAHEQPPSIGSHVQPEAIVVERNDRGPAHAGFFVRRPSVAGFFRQSQSSLWLASEDNGMEKLLFGQGKDVSRAAAIACDTVPAQPARRPRPRTSGRSMPDIEKLDISVYTVPTEEPESDGTLSKYQVSVWDRHALGQNVVH